MPTWSHIELAAAVLILAGLLWIAYEVWRADKLHPDNWDLDDDEPPL
jgi:hypothetical protein